jgi:hypothetical protein
MDHHNLMIYHFNKGDYMIRETSLVAYNQLKIEGKELTQKQRILKLINEENKPMSRKEISAVTGSGLILKL